MLTILRSKLWGNRIQQNVTGSGACTQSQQTNSGRCLWYSALTKNVAYLGTTIKKLIEGNALDERIILPSFEGEGASEQAHQQSRGHAEISFIGLGQTLQSQHTRAIGYLIGPISGTGSTEQEIGWGNAEAEHVDVELEVLAAILAAF